MKKPSRRATATALAAAALAVALQFSAPAFARDDAVKVLYDGGYYFCYTNPNGISLATFKSICQQIEANGKGVFVEYYVDRKGKMRRKAAGKTRPADLGLRGSFG